MFSSPSCSGKSSVQDLPRFLHKMIIQTVREAQSPVRRKSITGTFGDAYRTDARARESRIFQTSVTFPCSWRRFQCPVCHAHLTQYRSWLLVLWATSQETCTLQTHCSTFQATNQQRYYPSNNRDVLLEFLYVIMVFADSVRAKSWQCSCHCFHAETQIPATWLWKRTRCTFVLCCKNYMWQGELNLTEKRFNSGEGVTTV